MKVEINLSELFDVLSILSVWAEDMSQIAPEEALKTRTIMMDLEAQIDYKIDHGELREVRSCPAS